MGLILISPTPLLGVKTGLFLGLAYLTKASLLPAIIAFVFVFILKILFEYSNEKKIWERQFSRKIMIYNFASLSLVLIAFLSILFPYLQESKQTYGHYFYNVNSTFYIWNDSWDEVLRGPIYANNGVWPDLPRYQLPSFNEYVRNHSFQQVKDRFLVGLKAQLHYLTVPNAKINYLLIYAVSLFFFFAPKKQWGYLKKMIAQYWTLLLFFLLNLGGYMFLFSWYFPIAGGPRFIYGLFLPSLFLIFAVIKKITREDNKMRFANNIRWFNYLDIIIFSFLIYDFYYVVMLKFPNGYFGS